MSNKNRPAARVTALPVPEGAEVVERIGENDLTYWQEAQAELKAASGEYQRAAEAFNAARAKLEAATAAAQFVGQQLAKRYELKDKESIDDDGVISRVAK